MVDSNIRRSDRATKGQHNSRRSSEDATSAKPVLEKPKKGYSASGKKMGRPKKNSDPEPTKRKGAAPTPDDDDDGDNDDEEENEGEDVDDDIRCICGRQDEGTVGTNFIGCEGCDQWQHNDCMGVGTTEDTIPSVYYCERCRPEDHKETLEALARGEKIWEARKKALRIQRAAQTRERRKSGKNSAQRTASSRASLAVDAAVDDGDQNGNGDMAADSVTELDPEHETDVSNHTAKAKASPSEPPSRIAGSKRRRTEDSTPAPEPTADAGQSRRSSTARADKRIKSSSKQDMPLKQEASESPVVDVSPVVFDLLPKDRQNVVTAFTKITSDGIKRRSDAGTFKISSDETAESVGHQLAIMIEHEMFKAHSDAASKSAYQNQFRQVIPNLKSNAVLLDQLIHGTLTPARLAVMSSQEMASEEMQKRDAAMKEEMEKQAILVREDEEEPARTSAVTAREEAASKKPGGDESQDNAGLGEIEMSTDDAEPTPTADNPSSKNAQEEVQNADIRSRSVNGPAQPATQDERRASQQTFDINNVWAKTQQSPTVDQSAGRSFSGPATTTAISTQPTQQTEDADVDRLLADDNGDEDETYVPKEATPPQNKVIWQGQLVQPGVVEATVTGRYMAGSDFSRFLPWDQFLPTVIEIEGRLQKATADDYLCGLEWSRKSDVSVLALTPKSGADRKKFDEIFDYFLSRGRYAVGKKSHGISEHVKDLYMTPVEANTEPPPFIGRLEYCAIGFPCTERIMLATYVINKPASWVSASADGGAAPDGSTRNDSKQLPPGRQSLPPPAGSPLNHKSPGFGSPRDGVAAPGHQDPLHLMADPRISGILGQHVQSPVAQQIVSSAGPSISYDQLNNMRTILDHNEPARYDMKAFQEAMVRGV